MNGSGNKTTDAVAQPKRQRSTWPLIILAALFIIVPFLTWYTRFVRLLPG